MKVLLKVSVEELKNKINRQIIVDENINLIDLCEYIIISMNGEKIPLYALEYKNITYYPYEVIDLSCEKTLEDLSLKELKLKKKDKFYIKYNFDNCYEFSVIVEDIVEDNSTTKDNYFQVLSGKGVGILDNEYSWYLESILNDKRKDVEKYYKENIKDYLQKTFDVVENNEKINKYIEHKKELLKPKRYIFNVSLEGFNKEIKRKICVNNDVTIDSFMTAVIVSMNGDLSHGYGIKRNKEYLSEYYNYEPLLYLDLKEKQRLKIFYDWGDNWVFNVTVSKIIDGYSENDVEVLSGKGYGIIDDCGGTWYLEEIFNGNDTDWGKYDINDFDLEKCNEEVRKSV